MKILKLVISILIIITTGCCKQPGIIYDSIRVYDSNNLNIINFSMSYDDCDECSNNFRIINNTGSDLSYDFYIKQDGEIVYNGHFDLPKYKSIYFDNAFVNCLSSNSVTEIII